MPQGRIVLLFASLLACLPLSAQPALSGELGKRWKAKDWNGTKELLGQWVRRGDSSEFDVEYIEKQTRIPFFWRVTILGIDGQDVRFRAIVTLDGPARTYNFTGRILTDGRTIRGRGAWCKPQQPRCGFEVVADWTVADRIYKQFSRPVPPPPSTASSKSDSTGAASQATTSSPDSNLPQLKNLPPRWRVRDNSVPSYPYQGTWDIDGRDVRFKYTSVSGGAKAEGSMQLVNWDGTMIIIRNRGAGRVYEGLLQPGARVLRGTARPCPPDLSCTWEATLEK